MGFFPNLFKLPGTSLRTQASQGISGLTDLNYDQYKNYLPGIMGQMYQGATSVNPTALDQSLLNTVKSNAQGDYTHANNLLGANLEARGLNNGGLLGQNQSGALYDAYLKRLLEADQGQAQTIEQRRQNFTQQLMSMLQGLGSSSMQGFQQLGSMGQAQGQQALSSIGSLVSAFTGGVPSTATSAASSLIGTGDLNTAGLNNMMTNYMKNNLSYNTSGWAAPTATAPVNYMSGDNYWGNMLKKSLLKG
jgi:hypothetical protein